MTNPLNILMICHHLRHKAYGRSHSMAKNLVARGHKVTLLVISENKKFGIDETDWDGVRIVETPDMLWGRLRSGWDIWNTLNRIAFLNRESEHYDLVHCFETRPATIYPALFYVRRHRIPLVTDWNDWFGRGGIITILRPKWYQILMGGVETYYEEAFRKKGAGLTVISTALARRAAGLGIPDDRICYVSGGTHPSLFQVHPKLECRQRVGLPADIPVVCFSSGDSHIDLDLIMAAVADVAKKYPTVKLMVTGKTGKHVLSLAKEYGIEENLFLTGFLPFEDLSWYMGCADMFVLPFPETIYNLGRWPNKLGDYLCLGRPIISNPVGDIKALFENNEIGFLADFSKTGFYEKMIYLIENPEVGFKYGENARMVAENILDWNILVKKVEDFYYKTLNSGSV
jgi:glycosyltransferase involved in cell wall biosynthesis